MLKTWSVATIPESLGLKDVVVTPLGTNTFASGLSDFGILNLVIPPDVAAKKKTLLVWGASGSVGSSALQLALAAGDEVFAIIRLSDHEMLRSIGATERFDHRGSNMVSGLIQKLEEEDREIIGAFDVIPTEKMLHALCGVSDQTGARKYNAPVMSGAEQKSKLGIEIKTSFADNIEMNSVADHLGNDFLPTALVEGRFKWKPDPEVVGHGSEKIQEAVNCLADGVSAKKLVVTVSTANQ